MALKPERGPGATEAPPTDRPRAARVDFVPDPRRTVGYRIAEPSSGPSSGMWFRPPWSAGEHIPTEGPVILAPVHRSFADFGFAAFVTDRKLFFMAKDDLWREPLAGGSCSPSAPSRSTGSLPTGRPSGGPRRCCGRARCWSCSQKGTRAGRARGRRAAGGGGVPGRPHRGADRARRHRGLRPGHAQGPAHPQAPCNQVVVGEPLDPPRTRSRRPGAPQCGPQGHRGAPLSIQAAYDRQPFG